MPYANIQWIKLEKRLLNDPRFFTMSPAGQLFYIKFILLCAHFKNKVPRSISILRQLLRVDYDDPKMESLLNEIREHFPKVLSHKDYYYIKGFKSKHNWVSPGSSEGVPKDAADKIRKDKNEDKIRKEKITKVSEFFVSKKGYRRDELTHDDWCRMQAATKNLLLKAKTTEDAIEAIEWQAVQGYTWTLETVVKKYPEFLINRKSPALRKLEAEALGEEAKFS